MGVQDLLSWVKKAHPGALKQYPKRWAEPGMRGKRIAIDATLLTNRFHFAITDGPLKGKGGLVGWFNMINVMKAHDIKPIAIWDKPGKRSWKATEARRRLAVRALNTARRNHEESREERLLELREAFLELHELDAEEQDAIRRRWDRTKFLDQRELAPSTETRDDSSEMQPQSSGHKEDCAITPEEEEMVQRIANMESNLRNLVNRFRASIPATSTTHSFPMDLSEMEGHITELEDLSASLEDATIVDHQDRQKELDQTRRFVDEKLTELIPIEEFRESRSQSALTLEEGEVIKEFLSPELPEKPLELVLEESNTSVYPQQPPPPTILEEFPKTAPSPRLSILDKLNIMIHRTSPKTKFIYERALFQPNSENHEDCRELLGRMGVPILLADAPFEAEGLATALAKEGVVDFVGTEDSDVIALGGPLLRNLSTSRIPLVHISPEHILSSSKLSKSAFTDLCILLGTDASPRIKSVGPITALKYITEYESIEEILDNEPKVTDSISDVSDYLRMVKEAREVFKTLPEITKETKKELETLMRDSKRSTEEEIQKVEGWLEERHGIRMVSAEEEEGAYPE